MKQCRECGTLSNDDTIFCAVCGTKFLEEHFDTAESVSADQYDGHEIIPNRIINKAVIPLLQRISLFLEDEEYDRADAYCERVLDMEPMNAEAYIDKLLVEFRCSSFDQLQSCMSDISASKNYAKVLRFGNDQQRKMILSLNDSIQKILQEKDEPAEQGNADKKRQVNENDEEYYVDLYCPFCRAELSYTNWQISEGVLTCPECETQFDYDERLKRE